MRRSDSSSARCSAPPNRRAVVVGAGRGFGDGGGEALEALALVEGLFVERSGTGVVDAADGLGEQDGGV